LGSTGLKKWAYSRALGEWTLFPPISYVSVGRESFLSDAKTWYVGFRRGSHPSIEDLVAAYHSDVYRSALYLTGSTADAEDLTQQTFLQALQKLCQLRDPRSVKSWLLTIFRNSF
jgi:hypothetical protein